MNCNNIYSLIINILFFDISYGLDEVSQWFFEVWNEPNCGFWTGDQEEYFKLLKVTSQAIKSVEPTLFGKYITLKKK